MDLRASLIERLATPHVDTRFGQPYFPDQTLAALRCRPHELWQEMWAMVGEGLVYVDPAGQGGASSWDNWQWRLSTRGIEAASDGGNSPRDPEGYLRHLRRRCPDLDPAAERYVREALTAFNARCFLACSVMLGVAAEHVFGRLADAFVSAHGDRGDRLKALVDTRRSYYQRFTDLRKYLEPIRDELPEGAADRLTLDAVADLLRVTRNSAGHPTGAEVDEITAYTHMKMASGFLGKMTALDVHFEQVEADLIRR
jgi:hypothetical protein